MLDLQQLEELRELAEETRDPGFLARLVDQYLEDAASRVAELQEAMARRAAPALAAAAHALKGGSATMGALGVASRCAVLEAAGRRGELPGPDDLARVSAELQLAAAALQAQAPGPFEQAVGRQSPDVVRQASVQATVQATAVSGSGS